MPEARDAQIAVGNRKFSRAAFFLFGQERFNFAELLPRKRPQSIPYEGAIHLGEVDGAEVLAALCIPKRSPVMAF